MYKKGETELQKSVTGVAWICTEAQQRKPVLSPYCRKEIARKTHPHAIYTITEAPDEYSGYDPAIVWISAVLFTSANFSVQLFGLELVL